MYLLRVITETMRVSATHQFNTFDHREKIVVCTNPENRFLDVFQTVAYLCRSKKSKSFVSYNTIQDMENLRITESISKNLLSATKWIKLFTVIATVIAAFILLHAVIALTIPEIEGIPGFVFSILDLIYLALMYYYPIKKGFSVIKHTRASISNEDQEALEIAVEDNYKLLRYIGILFIITLILFVLFVIGMITILVLSIYD